MLNNYLIETIKKIFEFTPTASQNLFFERISSYLLEKDSNKIFMLKGYAGTGKTTAVSALVKTMRQHKMRTVLLAPTGRAAKVFSEYSGVSAWTVHKHIYRQQSEEDGEGNFVLDFNKAKDALFIIDEASMLSDEYSFSPFGSGKVLNDVIKFVFNSQNNNKLLMVGDTAQLPPVGLEISHALDADYLNSQYFYEVDEVVLTEVIRQKESSGILQNATELREKINTNVEGELLLRESADVKHINGNDLIEALSDAYAKVGLEETIVVTRSNKRANAYNEGIRRAILEKEEEISVGDFLMIVKNNYHWKDEQKKVDFIANGEIAEVVDFRRIEEVYGFRFVDATLRFVNYDVEIDTKLLLDTLTVEAPALSREDNKLLYFNVLEDYKHLRNKKQRQKALREDPYFNALQVKFAYAITCHKSQGGQWDKVFVDQGYLTDEMLNSEYYRWLYTAITRAKKQIYFVNFQEKYRG